MVTISYRFIRTHNRLQKATSSFWTYQENKKLGFVGELPQICTVFGSPELLEKQNAPNLNFQII
jgi:hypothetical protein